MNEIKLSSDRLSTDQHKEAKIHSPTLSSVCFRALSFENKHAS